MEQQGKGKSLWKLGMSCFVTHIAACVICLILTMSIGQISTHPAFRFGSGLLVLFVYFVIMFGNPWQEGNRDLNRYHFGRIEKDELRGVKIGLVAFIPVMAVNLVMIVACIFDLGVVSKYGMIVFRILNPHILNFINLLIGEKGLLEMQVWQSLVIALLTVVIVGACQLGYFLGFKDIVISDKLVYKNRKKK